jgi:hypothetical protein
MQVIITMTPQGTILFACKPTPHQNKIKIGAWSNKIGSHLGFPVIDYIGQFLANLLDEPSYCILPKDTVNNPSHLRQVLSLDEFLLEQFSQINAQEDCDDNVFQGLFMQAFGKAFILLQQSQIPKSWHTAHLRIFQQPLCRYMFDFFPTP